MTEHHDFMTVEQMLGEVIDLYREYVERHGYPPSKRRPRQLPRCSRPPAWISMRCVVR